MRKLSLKIEDLAVESFDVSAPRTGGTVVGHSHSAIYADIACTCWNTCNTCLESCGGTCQGSCQLTNCCVSAGCTDISRANSCQTACGCTDTGGETGYTDYGCQNTG